jgi:hypothetical protein
MKLSTHTHTQERLALVEWVARIGVVTAEALAIREGCTVASARARLSGARRAGLLARERPLTDQPAVFTATRAGLRASSLVGVAPARVSAASARHAIVCAAVAAALERRYPDHRLVGERELRRQESLPGVPVASASLGFGARGDRLLHRPDLVLLSPVAEGAAPVAVEVELTVKAPRRLLAICRAWARARHLAGVLYVVTPEVRGPLERAITEARASAAITQIPLEALAETAPRHADQRTVTASA